AAMDAPWQQDANGWVNVLRQAQALGIQTNLELVSIEPEKIRHIARPCLKHLDSLIVNEYELGALADTAIHDENGNISMDLCIAAAAKIHEYSRQSGNGLSLVVAHCPAFAIALYATGAVHSRPSFHVPEKEVVSTVGAGDAFAAGMLYGIHEQWHIDQSLELAHATAAASLRSANTVGSVESVQGNLEFARALK
ncbi:MAG: carbohydrate kinase family protein, partial [Pseudomonadota bacterium]